jgi:lipoprotein-anchoring transpeptidase ErfK/SrfK
MLARALAIGIVAACGLCASPSRAAELTLESVNAAGLNDAPGSGGKARKAASAAIIKAQVLLDRARFSPGVIDGRHGENVRKAIAAFQRANGLNETGSLDQDTWAKLTESAGEPVLKTYTIGEADVKGPFADRIPARMEDQAKLDRLAYTSVREELAERFHMDESLLKLLNPRARFDKAGEAIVVTNADEARPKARKGEVAKIEVDKAKHALRAYDTTGRLVAVFPASIGSKEKPAPSGTLEIEAVARNPTYTYNPEYGFKGVRAKQKFTIKPGPNNPVGVIWIDLSKEGYGIHGTPEPAKVGKSYSHGCIRLTNWDASDLAGMVEKGAKVTFLDSDAKT